MFPLLFQFMVYVTDADLVQTKWTLVLFLETVPFALRKKVWLLFVPQKILSVVKLLLQPLPSVLVFLHDEMNSFTLHFLLFFLLKPRNL